MKYPKNFHKLSLDQQESWLANQRLQILQQLDDNSRQLAIVRGGMKIKPQVEDVPGLDYQITQRAE